MNAVAIVLLVIFTLALLMLFVFVPYIKLQMRRRDAWTHIPQPEEIWVQNKGILYIDATDAMGIDIIALDPESGRGVHKWKDTWEEWQKRLKAHTVFYTGQRRPLGPL